MGIGNKIKSLFNVSEEEYYDEIDIGEGAPEDDDYATKDVRSSGFGFNRSRNDGDGKVVDIRDSASAVSASKPKVVFNKVDRYDENIAKVADNINDKRIVVLNLETCPNDVSVRIIDFLSGVAYANSGEMKRIAGRVYIITPYNVPLTGEMLDGIEHSY